MRHIEGLDQCLAELISWKKTDKADFKNAIYLYENKKVEPFDWNSQKVNQLLFITYTENVWKSMETNLIESKNEISNKTSSLLALDQNVYTLDFVEQYIGEVDDTELQTLNDMIDSKKCYIAGYGERGHLGGNIEEDEEELKKLLLKKKTLENNASINLKNILRAELVGKKPKSAFIYPSTDLHLDWIEIAISEALTGYGPAEKLNGTPFYRWFKNSGLALEDIYRIFACFHKAKLELDKDRIYTETKWNELKPMIGYIMYETCLKAKVWS